MELEWRFISFSFNRVWTVLLETPKARAKSCILVLWRRGTPWIASGLISILLRPQFFGFLLTTLLTPPSCPSCHMRCTVRWCTPISCAIFFETPLWSVPFPWKCVVFWSNKEYMWIRSASVVCLFLLLTATDRSTICSNLTMEKMVTCFALTSASAEKDRKSTE